MDNKIETIEEKHKRVATTIENLLKAEGLQMDVIHQVFFRPVEKRPEAPQAPADVVVTEEVESEDKVA